MTSSRPAPLLVAAGLVAGQGAVLVVLGVLEAASTRAERLALGLTTSLFFLGFGALLLVCAWSLRGRRSWARAPVLFAQLVELGLAWSFRSSETVLIPIGLAVLALVVLVGVLHPASIAALDHEPGEQRA